MMSYVTFVKTYQAKDGFKADIYSTECKDIYGDEFIGLKAVRHGDNPNDIGSGLFGDDSFKNITLKQLENKLEQ